jgi:hypothetical protein
LTKWVTPQDRGKEDVLASYPETELPYFLPLSNLIRGEPCWSWLRHTLTTVPMELQSASKSRLQAS